MHTFTVTFTDQHSNTTNYQGIIAYNKLTGTWLALSNQVIQGDVANKLNLNDDITVLVHQTA